MTNKEIFLFAACAVFAAATLGFGLAAIAAAAAGAQVGFGIAAFITAGISYFSRKAYLKSRSGDATVSGVFLDKNAIGMTTNPMRNNGAASNPDYKSVEGAAEYDNLDYVGGESESNLVMEGDQQYARVEANSRTPGAEPEYEFVKDVDDPTKAKPDEPLIEDKFGQVRSYTESKNDPSKKQPNRANRSAVNTVNSKNVGGRQSATSPGMSNNPNKDRSPPIKPNSPTAEPKIEYVIKDYSAEEVVGNDENPAGGNSVRRPSA